jgi:outer membrane autotransporter protein
VYPTTTGVILDDSRFVREAVLDRLHQRFESAFALALDYEPAADGDPDIGAIEAGRRVAVWGNAFGAYGDFNSDGNAASFDRGIGGFVTGLETAVDSAWRAGLVVGAQYANVNVPDRASSATVGTYSVAAYGAYERGPFAVRLGGAYSWNHIDADRVIRIPGFSDRLSASYDAGTAQVFGEAAYAMQFNAVEVEPFAGLAYVDVDADGFTEKGGAAALTASATGLSETYSTLGARFAVPFGSGASRFRGLVGWQHAFDAPTPRTKFAFDGGTASFAIAGVPIAEDALRLEVGLEHAFNARASVSLGYSGLIASDAQDHGGNAKFTVRF